MPSRSEYPLYARPCMWAGEQVDSDTLNPVRFIVAIWILFAYLVLFGVAVTAPLWIAIWVMA